MSCLTLRLSGQDSCFNEALGRYQQIVFVNKKDVKEFEIKSLIEGNLYVDLEPYGVHQISFELNDNSSGILFQSSENSSVINATFNKTTDGSNARYTHNVSVGIFGVSEQKKWLLKQFDGSTDYFAVLQHKSNLIEVFGFHNGFESNSYEYDNNVTLELTSIIDEYDVPYIYKSKTYGNETKDFDNLFSTKEKYKGDYNIDYNKDYNTK